MTAFINILNQTSDGSVSSSSQQSACDNINRITRALNTTIPLVWLILGTITNGLSLIVFSRKSMRQNSTFFYLAVMTLSDFIAIWFGSFRDFLAYKLHFFISGTLLCRMHVFVFFVSCQFSSWLLTAANVDRLFFVISHSLSKKWCTKNIAYRVSLILFILLACINFHFLLFVESNSASVNGNNDGGDIAANEAQMLSESTSGSSNAAEAAAAAAAAAATASVTINPIVYPLCQTKAGAYSTFYSNYYGWIDSSVFSFVPFIIMTICNVALINKVFSAKRNLYKKVSTRACANSKKSVESDQAVRVNVPQSNVNEPPPHMLDAALAKRSLSLQPSSALVVIATAAQQRTAAAAAAAANVPYPKKMSTMSCVTVASRSTSTNAQATDPLDRMRNMAFMIIGVTLLFIVFTVPINIYVPIMHSAHAANENESNGGSGGGGGASPAQCDDLVFCILNNMVNANHSISFFIYLMTNSKFQAEIAMILSRLRSILMRNFNLFVWCCGCNLNFSRYSHDVNEQLTMNAQFDNMMRKQSIARRSRASLGLTVNSNGNGNENCNGNGNGSGNGCEHRNAAKQQAVSVASPLKHTYLKVATTSTMASSVSSSPPQSSYQAAAATAACQQRLINDCYEASGNEKGSASKPLVSSNHGVAETGQQQSPAHFHSPDSCYSSSSASAVTVNSSRRLSNPQFNFKGDIVFQDTSI